MTCRLIVLALLCFVGAASTGSAQNAPADRSTGLRGGDCTERQHVGCCLTRRRPAKAGNAGEASALSVKPLSYPSAPLNYPSNEARLRTKQIDPTASPPSDKAASTKRKRRA